MLSMATCKISGYNVCPSDGFFFDTNVWIHIFGPIASAHSQKQLEYTRLLREIRTVGATIWISSLVISEYVNAVLRIKFGQWKQANGYNNANFKRDFRITNDYLEALREAKTAIDEILLVSTRRPDDFHLLDVSSVLATMGNTHDYNDAVIIDDCRRHGMKLVSDDKDITLANLPFQVITS